MRVTFILVLFSCKIFAQQDSIILQGNFAESYIKETRSFFKWIVKKHPSIKRVSMQPVFLKTFDLTGHGDSLSRFLYGNTPPMDSLITQKDSEYFLFQISQLKKKTVEINSTWDERIFKKKLLISQAQVKGINKKWGESYWYFSYPLFTIDKQYCYIQEELRSYPDINVSTKLYKKTTRGKWKLVKVLFTHHDTDH